MNTQRTIQAINAISEQIDKVHVHNGEKLAEEEVMALRAGACGALAGIVSLFDGEETGNGPAVIAEKMLKAAALAHIDRIDERL